MLLTPLRLPLLLITEAHSSSGQSAGSCDARRSISGSLKTIRPPNTLEQDLRASPGLKQGPFFDAFTIHCDSFICFAAGLADCPHIPKAKIQDIEQSYGKDSPFTRATLHGEFMDYGDGVNHILELPDIESWLASTIGESPGPTVFGCDFAAGGDDNVIVKRVGNKVAEILCWKDRDTANAAGRFIRELRRMGYEKGRKNMMVVGDATGIGKVVCDLIRESGIPIADFNFGGKSCEPGYKNEGTRIWYTVPKMIRESRIVPPDRHQETTKKLCAQLSSRRQKFDSGGKLWMETKKEMAARGVNSPDIADAFAMAFGVQPLISYSYMPFDDSGRQEIAHRQGWEYTPATSDYDDS
jgi:phage terminase large subunit